MTNQSTGPANETSRPGERPNSGPGVAVLFDWNGTLVDDLDRAWKASSAVAALHGQPAPTLGDFQARWSLPLALHLADLGVTDIESGLTQWNIELGRHGADLQPGVRHLLMQLRDMQVSTVVISAAGASVKADLQHHDLERLFDHIHLSVDNKAHVIGRYVEEQTTVYYVGDSEHDMAAALEGGAHAIGFSGGYCSGEALERAGAGSVVDDLGQVLAPVRSVVGH